jgi:hypothetical protein
MGTSKIYIGKSRRGKKESELSTPKIKFMLSLRLFSRTGMSKVDKASSTNLRVSKTPTTKRKPSLLTLCREETSRL